LHAFKTFPDREAHEESCPNKVEFEAKISQAQQVYQRHKHEFKKAQGEKRQQIMELYGSNNAAVSQQLPHLRYQYKMNEPFIGGEAATVQDSH
jgi:hypothetical protein